MNRWWRLCGLAAESGAATKPRLHSALRRHILLLLQIVVVRGSMPPKKRRNSQGDIAHHGRVTTRQPNGLPTAPPVHGQNATASKRRERTPTSPTASARYTPPIRHIRFRPGWHKVIGTALLVGALVVVVLNESMLAGGQHLLPGGHNPLYLIGGIVLAGYSTWWFGWFDRET